MESSASADSRRLRPYVFYDTATSVCHVCLRRCEAKIVFQDRSVYLHKWCPAHGAGHVLLADDVDYYRKARETFLKAPEMPRRFQTPMRWGCPYDCGLCPDHMQHSCLSLVEITDHCNLSCPVCYAESGPHRPGWKPLAAIEAMLDGIVSSEGASDVVQISGGEPTLHPELFAILDAARRRPIRHLMLNTNGLRLAQEDGFVERLAAYAPGFEVYLQLDSLRDEVSRVLRGASLAAVKRKALDRLESAGLSTTLVVTVKKGLNDGELDGMVRFALGYSCVRGVTLQPLQAAGRIDGVDEDLHRITLTEVRRRLTDGDTVFRAEDVLPVPCNPDALAMAYALKLDGRVVPVTGTLGADALLATDRSTIVFERDESSRRVLFQALSTGLSPEDQAGRLAELLCCLPRVLTPPEISYRNVFRVLIMAFLDARSFDVRVAKRSCVHIAQEDGRLIPFDTYNLFYRDGRAARLAELRAAAS